jgi:hypothetical protein
MMIKYLQAIPKKAGKMKPQAKNTMIDAAITTLNANGWNTK